MKTKKIPLRMCLGCGEMKPKRELIRVVKNKDGELFLDLTGKQNGRGAYICKNAECFAKAKKARRFEHKLEAAIPEEVYERLQRELSQE
ncbi:MAG: YlxR family protein [Clostridia bacterium]|nr:YlxR family protein [Clostridia bacterium]